jgi:hypothetical protein
MQLKTIFEPCKRRKEGMKKLSTGLVVLLAVLLVSPAVFAKMGSGKMTAASDDVNIEMFGSFEPRPTFVDNPDFNDEQTNYDFLIGEAGAFGEDDISVRTETRLGFKGYGKNWTFNTILEADFVFSKTETDRGAGRWPDTLHDSGMTGEDFGIEKLLFTYDFSDYCFPAQLRVGWETNWLDIETGGLIYADDHPHISLHGKASNVKWQVNYMSIYDDIDTADDEGGFDGNNLDWDVYSARMTIPVSTMNVCPIYAYSDNEKRDADLSYFGIQTFGKMGPFVPKAEFAYAYGDKDHYDKAWNDTKAAQAGKINGSMLEDDEADIGAYAFYASLKYQASQMFNPYLAVLFASGDDDAFDDDIEAYNAITSTQRYLFSDIGIEDSFIAHYVPVLGSNLYSYLPARIGAGDDTGYGGVSDHSSAESPGMQALFLGMMGNHGKWYYKLQGSYFEFEEVGALEDLGELGVFSGEGAQKGDIDDEMGFEITFRLKYDFSNHFSIANVISAFEPGDGIEDLRGDDYDDTAFMNTVEIAWRF